jgi:hypothetical protein
MKMAARSKWDIATLFVLSLLFAPAIPGQQSQFVKVSVPFPWPTSEVAALGANGLPKRTVSDFFNSVMTHTRGYWAPPDAPPMKVLDFRFVPLERKRFYLVLQGGTRWTQTYVLLPWGAGLRLTDMQTIVSGNLPLGMVVPDLKGNGVCELVTAEVPTGYPSASTAPIFWYRVWRFHNGVPQDASSQFPSFYREFVLREIDYPGRLLNQLEAQSPQDTRVPLAEIAYVRFKYERAVLGHPNAGLEEALAWAKSKNSSFFDLGVFSLADMPAPAAGKELEKLEQNPIDHDLVKLLLTRRAGLFAKTGRR